jgi:hypothetical protein
MGWSGLLAALALSIQAAGCARKPSDTGQADAGTAPKARAWESPPLPPTGDELTVKATIDASAAPRRLVVDIVARNRGKKDLFVLHRLWSYTGGGKRWDEEGAYRFVDKGSLRLLFGPAPLPLDIMVEDYQWPLATRLAPDHELPVQVSLRAPIQEYTTFLPLPQPPLPTQDQCTFAPVRVGKIVVIVQYIVSGPSVEARPSDLDPSAWMMSGALLSAYAEVAVPTFEVMRCNEPIQREALPGE